MLGNRDIKNDKRCGFEIITARDIDRVGVDGIIRRIKERVNGTKVYISVDIDVLDPAFAPGESTFLPKDEVTNTGSMFAASLSKPLDLNSSPE